MGRLTVGTVCSMLAVCIIALGFMMLSDADSISQLKAEIAELKKQDHDNQILLRNFDKELRQAHADRDLDNELGEQRLQLQKEKYDKLLRAKGKTLRELRKALVVERDINDPNTDHSYLLKSPSEEEQEDN